MIPVIREWKWGRNASRNCLLLSLYSFYYIILYYIYFFIHLFFQLVIFLFIFFQLPNSLICLNRFSLLAHLVFYITFVSNFQLLLVVYNIWIVTTYRFFIKYPEEGRLVRPKYRETSSRFSLCRFVIYANFSPVHCNSPRKLSSSQFPPRL